MARARAAFIGMALLAARLQAGFLDANAPARGTAMGGELAADASGSGALSYNPAGLGLDAGGLWARYQSLFSGIAGDSLGAGSLAAARAWGAWGATGLGWERFNNNVLQEDRLRLAWGKGWAPWGETLRFRLGLQADWLRRSFTLSPALGHPEGGEFPSQAWDFGLGCQLEPLPFLALAASVENAAEAQLGGDRLPRRLRLGACFRAGLRDPQDLKFSVSQRIEAGRAEAQAGAEWKLPALPCFLRAGMDRYHTSAGLGVRLGRLQVDYAYAFSGAAAAALPGSHALEIGLSWKAPRAYNAGHDQNSPRHDN
jgi:hypothetical protein